MRRTRPLRPSSRLALTLTLGAVTLVLSLAVWGLRELGRLHWGRAALVLASGMVFMFFAIGWAVK